MPLVNLIQDQRADAGAVAQVMAAQDLFAVARAKNDALAALAAGRIMAEITVAKVQRGPAEGEPAPPEAALALASSGAMFDLAKALAFDEGLAALIEQERGLAAPSTQRVMGAAGLIAGQAQDRWDLAFYAGDLAEVAVIGPGTAVLQITVTDSAGRVICQQLGPRDRLYCPFVPRDNGRFSVLVVNPGAGTVGYAVLIN